MDAFKENLQNLINSGTCRQPMPTEGNFDDEMQQIVKSNIFESNFFEYSKSSDCNSQNQIFDKQISMFDGRDDLSGQLTSSELLSAPSQLSSTHISTFLSSYDNNGVISHNASPTNELLDGYTIPSLPRTSSQFGSILKAQYAHFKNNGIVTPDDEFHGYDFAENEQDDEFVTRRNQLNAYVLKKTKGPQSRTVRYTQSQQFFMGVDEEMKNNYDGRVVECNKYRPRQMLGMARTRPLMLISDGYGFDSDNIANRTQPVVFDTLQPMITDATEKQTRVRKKRGNESQRNALSQGRLFTTVETQGEMSTKRYIKKYKYIDKILKRYALKNGSQTAHKAKIKQKNSMTALSLQKSQNVHV